MNVWSEVTSYDWGAPVPPSTITVISTAHEYLPGTGAVDLPLPPTTIVNDATASPTITTIDPPRSLPPSSAVPSAPNPTPTPFSKDSSTKVPPPPVTENQLVVVGIP